MTALPCDMAQEGNARAAATLAAWRSSPPCAVRSQYGARRVIPLIHRRFRVSNSIQIQNSRRPKVTVWYRFLETAHDLGEDAERPRLSLSNSSTDQGGGKRRATSRSDHLVGADDERLRKGEAKRLRRSLIQH
jgi:hypothetical protein